MKLIAAQMPIIFSPYCSLPLSSFIFPLFSLLKISYLLSVFAFLRLKIELNKVMAAPGGVEEKGRSGRGVERNCKLCEGGRFGDVFDIAFSREVADVRTFLGVRLAQTFLEAHLARAFLQPCFARAFLEARFAQKFLEARIARTCLQVRFARAFLDDLMEICHIACSRELFETFLASPALRPLRTGKV